MKKIVITIISWCFCIVLLAGCHTNTLGNSNGDILGPGQEDVISDANRQETQNSPSEESTSNVLHYVKAEFGAPISFQGRFPVREETSEELRSQIPLDTKTWASYITEQVPDNRPIIWLQTDAKEELCIYIDNQQYLIEWEGIIYDGTALIDIDAILALLETEQLHAVLDDFPGITELQVDAFDYYNIPENTSYHVELPLDYAQASEVQDALQINQWSIVDMYTAQELARGWADFITLCFDGKVCAKVTSGEVDGQVRTMVFYYIDGDSTQCANLFAPAKVYSDLYSYIQVIE